MVRLIINPIYPLYSGIYWVSPFKGLLGGQTARVPSQGYNHFPYECIYLMVASRVTSKSKEMQKRDLKKHQGMQGNVIIYLKGKNAIMVA